MSEKITRFGDLIAWQKARLLTAEIYKVTAEGKFAKDYGLRGQVQRASVSVMSNIAEGFERGKPSEFHQFLSIAKGSCGELRSELYVALDAHYLNQDCFRPLLVSAEELARIIGGLRVSVERKRGF